MQGVKMTKPLSVKTPAAKNGQKKVDRDSIMTTASRINSLADVFDLFWLVFVDFNCRHTNRNTNNERTKEKKSKICLKKKTKEKMNKSRR